jgi:Ni/Co efflux regulator RcnB
MNIKKILMAAAATAVLSVAGVSAASAQSDYSGDSPRYDRGYHDHDRDNNRDNNSDRDNGWHRGWDRHSGWRHEHRRFADRDTIFRSLRDHRIHYVGEPYFVRGHYVVRSYDHFGRVSFIEINPYTGDVIGVIRL